MEYPTNKEARVPRPTDKEQTTPVPPRKPIEVAQASELEPESTEDSE